MTAQVGDKIIVESEKAGQPGREGEVEEVVHDDPPRYRVRWTDGRTTIFAPTAGVARIEPKKRKKAKTAS
ncbi:MAG: DUF1918 domain-containing protein [Actinomycetota bacterium]|nr:DUF1918 domain-containing protein [Actinomycetota bacterium]